MPGETVRIAARDGGAFEAYLATPAGGRGPGMVVLPEIYNANHWVRSVADRWAAEGYVAIAPDVYWRHEPGLYLQYNPEDQQRGRELGAGLDLGLFMEDLRAAVGWLRARPDCTGKVGSVGFCLGGKLVYLAMARHVLDAGVAYYAVQLADHLDESKSIDGPLMMHFGALDHRVPPDLFRTVCERLSGKPDVLNYWYEGADHGFNRDGYPPYHPQAAGLAHERSREFFRKHLGT